MNTPDRFWARIDKTTSLTGCWLWTGFTDRGYGSLRSPWGTLAHRVAWALTHGPIPETMQVLHKDARVCPRTCCNPEHLYLGTLQDNMNDRTAQERHGSMKVTMEQVRAIRENPEKLSIKELAARFALDRRHVWAIRSGRRRQEIVT